MLVLELNKIYQEVIDVLIVLYWFIDGYMFNYEDQIVELVVMIGCYLGLLVECIDVLYMVV